MISKSALKLFSGLAAICAVTLGSAVTEAASNTSNNMTIAPPVGAMRLSAPITARSAATATARQPNAATNKTGDHLPPA